jgi:hypothetical protein
MTSPPEIFQILDSSERASTSRRIVDVETAAMATYAAKHLVNESDLVLLDSGTSTAALGRLLSTRNDITILVGGLSVLLQEWAVEPVGRRDCVAADERDIRGDAAQV